MEYSSVYGDWSILKSVEPSVFTNTKMITITKGSFSNCALLVTNSAAVYAVGSSTCGVLGLGDVTETAKPLQLNGLSGVMGACICGGYGDALAFTKTGQLYVWGKNISNGTACGTPTLKPELTDVVDARCVYGHYLALTSEGKVYEWRGDEYYGSSTISTTPTVKPFDKKILEIACREYLSLAVTEDGQVYVWGLDADFEELPLSTVSVEGETFIKVVCGDNDCAGLTASHKIFTWNTRSGSTLSTPVQVGGTLRRFVDIASNYNGKFAAITDSGVVYTWDSGKETSLTRTDFIELHQVFAEEEVLRLSWKCKEYHSLDTDDFVSWEINIKECFNKKETSDLTVLVGNRPIYVHKLVLNLRSKFFHTLLQNQGTDKDHSEIALSSFNYEVFVSYFWYLYSSEVKSVPENLLELWTLADVYNEDKLKLSCEQLMEKTMTFVQVAKQYSKKCNKLQTLENLCIEQQEKLVKLEEKQDETKAIMNSNRELEKQEKLDNNNAEIMNFEELRIVIEEQQKKLKEVEDINEKQHKELQDKIKRLENVNKMKTQQDEIQMLRNLTAEQKKPTRLEDMNVFRRNKKKPKYLKPVNPKYEEELQSQEIHISELKEELESVREVNAKQHNIIEKLQKVNDEHQEMIERLQNVNSKQQVELEKLEKVNKDQQRKLVLQLQNYLLQQQDTAENALSENDSHPT